MKPPDSPLQPQPPTPFWPLSELRFHSKAGPRSRALICPSKRLRQITPQYTDSPWDNALGSNSLKCDPVGVRHSRAFLYGTLHRPRCTLGGIQGERKWRRAGTCWAVDTLKGDSLVPGVRESMKILLHFLTPSLLRSHSLDCSFPLIGQVCKLGGGCSNLGN